MLENIIPNRVCFVGIDPGTTKIGVSAIYCRPDLSQILSVDSFTIHADKLNLSWWVEKTSGARRARLDAAGYELLKFLYHSNPTAIATEAPFYNMKRPNAFAALMESVSTIESVLHEYNFNLRLQKIDPPTVKRAIGAPGNADKDLIKKTMKKHLFFGHQNFIDIETLDEHSLDSLAVCYCLFRTIYEGTQRLPTYF